MLSFDTNIAVHAANSASPLHRPAYEFLASVGPRSDVAVCELMLVELYLKLRNTRIFPRPLTAAQAAAVCQGYRSNRAWRLIETAPVMDEVWRWAASRGFAFRRIIDVRLGLTLLHHGVTELATTNVKDFDGLHFARVWNPIAASS
jgi:toxin-antitoxin system PIN domain toxin